MSRAVPAAEYVSVSPDYPPAGCTITTIPGAASEGLGSDDNVYTRRRRGQTRRDYPWKLKKPNGAGRYGIRIDAAGYDRDLTIAEIRAMFAPPAGQGTLFPVAPDPAPEQDAERPTPSQPCVRGVARSEDVFWVVYNPEHPAPPRVRFRSKKAAQAAATDMAERYPGEKFYAMKAEGFAFKPLALWTPVADEPPF